MTIAEELAMRAPVLGTEVSPPPSDLLIPWPCRSGLKEQEGERLLQPSTRCHDDVHET